MAFAGTFDAALAARTRVSLQRMLRGEWWVGVVGLIGGSEWVRTPHSTTSVSAFMLVVLPQACPETVKCA